MNELDAKRQELLTTLAVVGWVKFADYTNEVMSIYAETMRALAESIVTAFVQGLRPLADLFAEESFNRRYALHRQRKQRRVRR